MQIFKGYFELLPERYRKENTEKLYYVLMGGYDEYNHTISDVENSRNIDSASGKTLDLIGENVGQFRIDEDDELYRLLIKTRIIANRSNGDLPTINQVSSIILKEIFLGVIDAWEVDYLNREPAAIVIDLNQGMQIPHEIFNRIKAAAVRIYYKYTFNQKIYQATQSQVLRHTKHNIPEPTTQYEKYNRFAVYPRSAKYIKTMIDVVPIQHTNSKINTFTATQIGKEIKFETFKAYSTSLYIQDMLSNTLYEFKE